MEWTIVWIALLSLSQAYGLAVERNDKGDIMHNAGACLNSNWIMVNGSWSCACDPQETAIHGVSGALECAKKDGLDNSANAGEISILEQGTTEEATLRSVKKQTCTVRSCSIWNYNNNGATWDTTWSNELTPKMSFNSTNGKLTIAMSDSEVWQGLLLRLNLDCKNDDTVQGYSTLIKVTGERSYPILSPLLYNPKSSSTPAPTQTSFDTEGHRSRTETASSGSPTEALSISTQGIQAKSSTEHLVTKASLTGWSTDVWVVSKDTRASDLLGLGLGIGAILAAATIAGIIIVVMRKRLVKMCCKDRHVQSNRSQKKSHEASLATEMVVVCDSSPTQTSGRKQVRAWDNPRYEQNPEDRNNFKPTYQTIVSLDSELAYAELSDRTVYAPLTSGQQQEENYTSLETKPDKANAPNSQARQSATNSDTIQSGFKRQLTPLTQIANHPESNDSHLNKQRKRSPAKTSSTQQKNSNEETYTAIKSIPDNIYLCYRKSDTLTDNENEPARQDMCDNYQSLCSGVPHQQSIYTAPESTAAVLQPIDQRIVDGINTATIHCAQTFNGYTSTEGEPLYREVDTESADKASNLACTEESHDNYQSLCLGVPHKESIYTAPESTAAVLQPNDQRIADGDNTDMVHCAQINNGYMSTEGEPLYREIDNESAKKGSNLACTEESHDNYQSLCASAAHQESIYTAPESETANPQPHDHRVVDRVKHTTLNSAYLNDDYTYADEEYCI